MRKKPKPTGLGPELKRRREAAAISVNALADRIGVSPSTLRRIEDGEIADLRFAMLVALARELRFGLDDIAAAAGLLERDRPLAPRGLGARDLDEVSRLSGELASAIAALKKRAPG